MYVFLPMCRGDDNQNALLRIVSQVKGNVIWSGRRTPTLLPLIVFEVIIFYSSSEFPCYLSLLDKLILYQLLKVYFHVVTCHLLILKDEVEYVKAAQH